MFLAVVKTKVIDVMAQAAVAEVLDEDGITVLQPAVSVVTEESHLEVSQVYLESAGGQVAMCLNDGQPIDYYHIDYVGEDLVAVITPVKLKEGPRMPAPNREYLEIEAGGQDVGSAVIEVG